MQYAIAANVEVRVVQLGNPFLQWQQRRRTRRLCLFDSIHEKHEQHYVFFKDGWKLLVKKQWAWRLKAEPLTQRVSDRTMLLVEEDNEREAIYVVNGEGRFIDRMALGHHQFKAYRDILIRGEGKDPFDART